MTEQRDATDKRSRIEVAGPPDPRDLDGDFAHRHRVVVRFGDTDAMGHVNNAVYLTFAEAGRLAWWSAATGEPIQRESHRDEGLILAEAEVAFRSPVIFGEDVDVETRATRIGRTSIGVDHRLTARPVAGQPRLAAVVRTVMVRYDYAAGAPTSWPEELIERIEAFEGRSLRA
ncbi:MAG TPA: thioesterase family protein [Candidatus Limnocylindrales bacterium]|jgi:acyl-CoA thioester hydrolase|nr:thioesterase family protein [Candidatus Limnocylindrales bacterium]